MRLPAGAKASVELKARIPAADWNSRPNTVDLIDLIGVTKDGATILRSGPLNSQGTFAHTLTIPPGGIVIRARGRRIVENGPDLLFHTNPISSR